MNQLPYSALKAISLADNPNFEEFFNEKVMFGYFILKRDWQLLWFSIGFVIAAMLGTVRLISWTQNVFGSLHLGEEQTPRAWRVMLVFGGFWVVGPQPWH